MTEEKRRAVVSRHFEGFLYSEILRQRELIGGGHRTSFQPLQTFIEMLVSDLESNGLYFCIYNVPDAILGV